MEKAYLVLQNGKIFEGRRIGAPGDPVGELVFTTGMAGYLETLSDPSYAGQIVVQTFPLIGNYGVIPEDLEGACFARGYVVRELCDTPSNFRSGGRLDEFLKERGIPGIEGIDTRAVTRILRDEGVMNARICSAIPSGTDEIRDYAVRGVVREVSAKEPQILPAAGETLFRVALIDYGAKKGITDALRERGCEVVKVPHDMPAEAVLDMKPDGVMLSNGPGDPKENVFEIAQIRKILGKVPVFGICLGHQLTALALGGDTVKLKFGHRGTNQPVRCLADGRTYVTSQNHGYAVVSGSLEKAGRELYVNANDGSCEGMEYPDLGCVTVQFHPEARSGPRDTRFLFDRFISRMKGDSHA